MIRCLASKILFKRLMNLFSILKYHAQLVLALTRHWMAVVNGSMK